MKKINDVLGSRGQEEKDDFREGEKSYPVTAEMTKLTEVTNLHPMAEVLFRIGDSSRRE